MEAERHKVKQSWVAPKVVVHGDVIEITRGKTLGSSDATGYQDLDLLGEVNDWISSTIEW